jgi:hypothetical protein
MSDVSRFNVQWTCRCGHSQKVPSCQKCGTFSDGWEAIRAGWKVTIRAVQPAQSFFKKGQYENKV